MAYLSVADYVLRYGLQETARLTNETKATPGAPPVMVASKVEEAIEDASNTINGYVSTRYALPLANVPGIVMSWAATLAREFLHKSNPTDAVTEAADRVRKQLVDLSTRKLGLPLPEGGTVAETGGGAAHVAVDRLEPTFSPSRLNGYMGTFGSPGSRLPRWIGGGR